MAWDTLFAHRLQTLLSAEVVDVRALLEIVAHDWRDDLRRFWSFKAEELRIALPDAPEIPNIPQYAPHPAEVDTAEVGDDDPLFDAEDARAEAMNAQNGWE